MTATVGPLAATEGVAFQGLVAHFTDSNPAGTAADYTATITWGDGSISTVTAVATAAGQVVADAGGGFDVIGTNTYAEEGSATVVVVITDAKGPRLTAQGTAAVADAPLSLALQAPSPVQGVALSGVTVATFTDADPAGTAADYTATITWGDGTDRDGHRRRHRRRPDRGRRRRLRHHRQLHLRRGGGRPDLPGPGRRRGRRGRCEVGVDRRGRRAAAAPPA